LSAGLVIVTHGASGAALRAEAEFIVGSSLQEIRCVPFNGSGDHPEDVKHISEAIDKASSGDGALVMTDLIGASPSNRVAGLLEEHDAMMVTGVNLAMVLCAWANREMPLEQLTRKVAECGRRSTKIFQK
jgi:mannose/fructose-specific phosphotransferase system component IIA